jgi:hypothetical protein
MGEENWVQRQPGSVAGSVVPPAVPEIAPPLPKRTERHAPQPLPDSLRALFKPVWTPDQPATDTANPDHDVVSSAPRGQAGQKQGRSRGGTRQQIARVAAIVIVMLAASGTALVLTRQHAGGPARGPGGAPLTGLSQAAAVRHQTGAWISRDIGHSAIVACDAVMCADLLRDGLPASNLLGLGPKSLDPLGADVVVATPVLRSLFGKRLRSVYAPMVLASFGSGPARVDILAVAPGGAAAYESALARDLAARKAAGAQLLGNDQIALSASARAELTAGRIDPRLLIMLPAMAHLHPIQITGFGDQAPGASLAVPLTSVELSGTNRLAGLTGHGYLSWLLGFLRGQRLPYRAASITTLRSDGRQAVIVRFARPSPIGLLIHG